ncbi:MATH domain and coiled-coil domain-containing protein [Drosera capensis]
MAPPNGSELYTFSVQGVTDVIRSVREAMPTQYLVQIESFTDMKDSIAGLNPEHFESTEFDATGHKWVLVIYPHGNKDEDGEDHISLYLKLISPQEHTYDAMEKEKGIAHAIPFSDFTQSTNGFLKNDRCKFGVEVFVADTVPRTAALSVLNEHLRHTVTWTIKEFSKLTEDQYSNAFTRKGRTELVLNPRGFGPARRKSLSLFLNLVDFSDLTNGRKLLVEKTLRVKNQLNGEDASESTCGWYTKAMHCSGTCHLLSVSDLHNANKGFKVEDQHWILATCGWYTKARHSSGTCHLLSVSDLHNANKGFKVEDQNPKTREKST